MPVSIEHELAIGEMVMGIDEAGRGPLAGGVFAAAVSVSLDLAGELLKTSWSQINDSKKLSEKKRAILANTIKQTPGCIYSIAQAYPKEIDELNILRATHLAMHRAAQGVAEQLKRISKEDIHILVDGLPVPSLPFQSQNIIKGDGKSLLIAAASILAKTTRDEDCLRMDALYPRYGFAKHKGYPTKAHFEALAKFGPCPEHRKSFSPVAQYCNLLPF